MKRVYSWMAAALLLMGLCPVAHADLNGPPPPPPRGNGR